MNSKSKQTYAGKIRNPLDDVFGAIASEQKSVVSLAQIHLPKTQPRRYFDPQAQQDLIESIKQHGILQPLLVRPLAEGDYELVAGERRYRAAAEAGLEEVPVVERDLSDTEAFQLALIENLQREDLNPVEETEGILHLLALELKLGLKEVSSLLYRLKHQADKGEQSGHNIMPNSEENIPEEPGHNVMPTPELKQVESIFSRLGLMTWESFVKNRLPLLKLPEEILEALRSGKLAYTKAKAIASIKQDQVRKETLDLAIAQDWSLSQIKEYIKGLKPKALSVPLKQQFEDTYQKVKKAKIWEDPERQERLRNLLAELEGLLE